MAQPTLVLQHRSGAAPQVYRVSGSSAIALGDPIGVAVEGVTPGTTVTCHNRVIQFQGDVYAAVNGAVFKKDDPTLDTGPWSSDHSFTNFIVAATTKHHIFGPFQFTENGTPKLFVCWRTNTSTNTWNASILNGSTDVWSDIGEQTAADGGADNRIGASIIYRGVLYVQMAGSTHMLTFDPSAQSFGVLSNAAFTNPVMAGMAIFNDRLLMVGRSSGTNNVALAEITGSINLIADSGIAAFDTSDTRHGLFPGPDGTFLYSASRVSASAGSRFLKFIDTAGVISYSTDLTAAVMPAARQPGSDANNIVWWGFYDQETTPGTARLQIYYSPNANTGSLVTQYRFIDESTTLLQDDIGASAAWAWVNTLTGGGERIFTPGELHIEIVNRLAVLGGEAVRFKAWGATGADKQVDFRYNSQTEVPLSQATLTGTPTVVSGPAPAPTRLVNVLQGVTADGVTVYQTTWNITANGLVSGQRAQLVPRIFV
jgi:hypothetical protein